LLASGSSDSTAKLWQVETGRELTTFGGFTKEVPVSVESVAFSPDGRWLATGTDETVKLWEISTGREIYSLDYAANCIAFSPDGRRLVMGGYFANRVSIKLLDLATKNVSQLTDLQESIYALTFSPDGGWLVTSGQNSKIRIWDMSNRKVMHTINYGTRAVAFSPDGKWLAFGSSTEVFYDGDTSIKLLEIASGKVLRLIGHTESVNAIAFSPDSRQLASGGDDDTIRLWEVATGREIKAISSFKDNVQTVAFSPDGRWLACGNRDSTFKLFEMAAEREISLSGQIGGINALALSPDRRWLASGGDDRKVMLWELTTGRQARILTGHSTRIESVAFSPDSRWFASGSVDGNIKLWAVDSDQAIRTLGGSSEGIKAVAISPDGHLLAAESSDATVKIWNVATGRELRTLGGHSEFISSITFHPDGRILASGDFDTIRLWDVETGRLLRTLSGQHSYAVESLAFHPRGQWLASSGGDSSIRLWETSSGRLLRTFSGHTVGVNALAFSPDGRMLASGSNDNTIKVWNVASGKELKTLIGHTQIVYTLAFGQNGIVSGSGDGTMRFWDSESGNEICRLLSFNDGSWAAVAPDGRFDTNNLGEIPGLHWIMPDDPLRPLPIEIFMREYYEPKILPRLLAGEKFVPLRSLAELNRVQPIVKIKSIQRQTGRQDYVAVEVEVSGAKQTYQRGDRRVEYKTGVHDLRLFRNGQLVGYYPRSQASVPENLDAREEDPAQWRQSSTIKVDAATGRATLKFDKIRLPHRTDDEFIEFSAYAFNSDKVKSITARRKFKLPEKMQPQKGRAYMIGIGVNACENASWDLTYAANDASRLLEELPNRLVRTKNFKDVVVVPLISDYQIKGQQRVLTQNLATKANIKAVLDLLAGRTIKDSLRQSIPNVGRIRAAVPDDFVLISFSSHGFMDQRGNFYLVPYDIGKSRTRAISREVVQKSISSMELSVWLRDLDAGHLVMIVDACHSAGTVESGSFKPGPMGSRGLGQLAYDKGMQVLTSTQADDVALESKLTQHGLLSYALIQDGIVATRADFQPNDNRIYLTEWLSYAVERVPNLYNEIMQGQLQVLRPRKAGRGVAVLNSEVPKSMVPQQPSLFDFRRQASPIVLLQSKFSQ